MLNHFLRPVIMTESGENLRPVLLMEIYKYFFSTYLFNDALENM